MSGKKDSRPLYKALSVIEALCYLQTQKEKVMTPYLVGIPGGGKTESLVALAKKMNYGFVSTHFAMTPIEELGGIPQFEKVSINGKEVLGTVWSYPAIMKHLFELSTIFQNGVIWLLDDAHQCGPTHMNMMFPLLTNRTIRDYQIPDNVAMCLAGNHQSTKAGAKVMFSAIMNRLCLLPVETTYAEWKNNFAIKNEIHPAIISFLGNPSNSQFFHEEEQVDSPWCSPRSWSRFSTVIRNMEKWSHRAVDQDTLAYIGSGHLSKDASSAFLTYYTIFSQFDIPKELASADTFKVSSKQSDSYAFAFALLSNFLENENRETNMTAYCKIFVKYCEEAPDLGLGIIHELIDMEKILKNDKTLYIRVAKEMNRIKPGITRNVLDDANMKG